MRIMYVVEVRLKLIALLGDLLHYQMALSHNICPRNLLLQHAFYSNGRPEKAWSANLLDILAVAG